MYTHIPFLIPPITTKNMVYSLGTNNNLLSQINAQWKLVVYIRSTYKNMECALPL